MKDGILTLNAGSSSLKFALFCIDIHEREPSLLIKGQIAGIGTAVRIKLWRADGEPVEGGGDVGRQAITTHQNALSWVLDWLQTQVADVKLVGVGHRVVHGGSDQRFPALVTPSLMEELEALCTLAPHHQPHNLAAIRAVMVKDKTLPQVACFDTAFHAAQPPLARRLPLPRRYQQQGIQRYGFHGLSYEYIVDALPKYSGDELPERLIVAHLGNGASLCGVKNGVSTITTMGFSTLDGVMMGTRSGAVDPGVLLHLMREENMTEAQLSDLVYNQCGLLGVSGISSDMQELLNSEDANAREAIELFCYSIVQSMGALMAVLGGVDALVFTGGIGEHAPLIRSTLCRKLGWLGLRLDEATNSHNGPLISTSGSAIEAWVIPTDEELVIARHTNHVLQQSAQYAV
ncbi:MAG: acetate/propionate family kinase [Chromatiales bacterium]|nr:acetate/propionate family kinase [Chromatiales bacterium]